MDTLRNSVREPSSSRLLGAAIWSGISKCQQEGKNLHAISTYVTNKDRELSRLASWALKQVTC